MSLIEKHVTLSLSLHTHTHTHTHTHLYIHTVHTSLSRRLSMADGCRKVSFQNIMAAAHPQPSNNTDRPEPTRQTHTRTDREVSGHHPSLPPPSLPNHHHRNPLQHCQHVQLTSHQYGYPINTAERVFETTQL